MSNSPGGGRVTPEQLLGRCHKQSTDYCDDRNVHVMHPECVLAELRRQPDLLVRFAVIVGVIEACDTNCSEHYDGNHYTVQPKGLVPLDFGREQSDEKDPVQ